MQASWYGRLEGVALLGAAIATSTPGAGAPTHVPTGCVPPQLPDSPWLARSLLQAAWFETMPLLLPPPSLLLLPLLPLPLPLLPLTAPLPPVLTPPPKLSP